jgi:hypothetical protein
MSKAPIKGRARGVSANIPDLSLLSAAEQAELRKIAADEVMAERKKAARDAAIEAFKEEARIEADPEEELFEYQLDLAGHADRIALDGKVFLHGQTYQFTRKELDTVHDIVAQTWKHEDEIGGANRDYYLRPRQVRVGPNDVGRSNSSIMRV